MSHKLLVSIIVRTYNRDKVVHQAINSIVNQSYPNIEVIVVNDLSTDNTMKILKNIKKRDSRVKIYQNLQEKGSAGAMRTGVSLCEGDAIAFLDDDDEYLPDKILTQVDILKGSPEFDLVVSGVDPELFSGYSSNQHWVRTEFFPLKLFQPSSIMCRRHVIENIKVRWGNMEWRDFAFEVYMNDHNVFFDREKLFRVNNTTGSMGSHSLKRYTIALENAIRYYETSNGKEEHDIFIKYLAVCYKNLGNYCLKKLNIKFSIKNFMEAYRLEKKIKNLIPFI